MIDLGAATKVENLYEYGQNCTILYMDPDLIEIRMNSEEQSLETCVMAEIYQIGRTIQKILFDFYAKNNPEVKLVNQVSKSFT